MPVPPKLTEADFAAAAQALSCPAAAIKAVAEVESSGDGFLADGRLRILFEGHKFYAFTNGKYAAAYPTICYPAFNKDFYCTGTPEQRGAGELARLDQAIALDPQAARKSCSIGKFQIMGFNYKICGFPDVDAFWTAHCISEGEHLKAFCAFVKSNGLDRYLRAQDWADFARRYNGKDYAANKYDTRLAAAFAKYSA